MTAWVNAVMYPMLKNTTDAVAEMQKRCVSQRADMLSRQAAPREPGYVVFPNHGFVVTRDVAVTKEEFEEWKNQPLKTLFLVLIACVDYRFSSVDKIHSTNMVYFLNKKNPSTPDQLEFGMSPDISNIDAGSLVLFQEPFGDTYAD
jgi:hypothetical protein